MKKGGTINHEWKSSISRRTQRRAAQWQNLHDVEPNNKPQPDRIKYLLCFPQLSER